MIVLMLLIIPVIEHRETPFCGIEICTYSLAWVGDVDKL